MFRGSTVNASRPARRAAPAVSLPVAGHPPSPGAGPLRRAGWLAAGVLAVALLFQPVGTPAQLALGLVAITLMTALRFAGPGDRARYAFITLGSFVVLRYAYWRVTSTLPSPDDPVDFGFALLLLAAEAYCVLILAISLVVNADPLTRPAPPLPEPGTAPAVDVFVPSYNESAAILAVTLAAALRMDYPPGLLTVWLLDDGGTDQKCADADPARAAAARARRRELQALCRELGARYLTRARNTHAKAGNLNNGLQHARGEIVVVFDADHAPFRSFLTETVGHFAQDPALFLVQTPHVFLNPDPIEKNLRTFDRMPSENEMFYALTQRGLDKWNGSFFCGSAALLRRRALDATGGFSGITITEDCETAFELHAAGWTSLYTERPLIAGLQPETFESFIGQRSRWCQGMFQILLLKNPVLKPGLTPIQRLAYLSSMVYWFFPLPRLVFMLAPLLHIFFDIRLFVASLQETVAYTLTYMVVSVIMQNHLYGRLRWPWMSELYEYVQGLYLAKAIASVLLSPRKPTFNVTAKGETLARDHLSALAWPYVGMFLLLAAGVLTAAWRYVFDETSTELMLVVGGWCLFGTLLAGAALGVVAERRQQHRFHRLPVEREATLLAGGQAIPVAIVQVSSGDCVAVLPDDGAWRPEQGGPATLVPLATRADERLAPVAVTIEALRGGTGGCEAELVFAAPSPAEYVTIADLMYGDATAIGRMLERRRRHKGVLAGSWQMLLFAVCGPVRALGCALRRGDRTQAGAAPADVPVPAWNLHPTRDATAISAGIRKVLADAAAAPGQLPRPANVPASAVADADAADVAAVPDGVPRPSAVQPSPAAAWAQAIARQARADLGADVRAPRPARVA